MEFSEAELDKVLFELTKSLEKQPGFISIFYNDDDRIVVTIREGMPPTALPDRVTLQDFTGAEREIEVLVEVGNEIGSLIGDVRENPPRTDSMEGNMGGDHCRNAVDMNSYGTISFFTSAIEVITQGGPSRCRDRWRTSPALVSNNHVIARSDAGAPGEVIWTPFRTDTARLHKFVPLSCPASLDLATATLSDSNGIDFFSVRGIGRLAPPSARPYIGQGIRKRGARTGLTSGTVTGKGNIRVGGYTYYNVFHTTGGFSCPGDSGSLVVDAGNAMLGILSWGDRIPCEQNPRGYFFPFIDPGTKAESDNFIEALFLIDKLDF